MQAWNDYISQNKQRFLDELPPARLVAERDAVADFFGAGARATA